MAAAYLRYLPWRILRTLCWTLFLFMAVAGAGLLGAWDWPWLVVKLLGVLLIGLTMLLSLVFVARPACLVNTTSAGNQEVGLLDSQVHRAALQLGWQGVNAQRVTPPLLEDLLMAHGVSGGALETALKLHADGWDGTCGELCQAAEML